jgi:phosphatidylinositol-3-phosphatase
MIIVLENREASQVIGSPSAPAINALAVKYGQATQAYATGHPSLPNYLELIAGTTFGITTDCTTCSVEGQTLADQLSQAGIGWRAYMEGISSACPTQTGGNGYAKKHDPFVYFRHIVRAPNLCDNVVPLSGFSRDLHQGGPPFLWVTPNLCHDGHDCSNAIMDSWVDQTMRTVMASPWYAAGGTVLLTFDEGTSSLGCCGGAHGGHIAAIVVRSGLGPGARLDAPVDQAGFLRSIEDVYGLGHLGDATCDCAGSLAPLLGS